MSDATEELVGFVRRVLDTPGGEPVNVLVRECPATGEAGARLLFECAWECLPAYVPKNLVSTYGELDTRPGLKPLPFRKRLRSMRRTAMKVDEALFTDADMYESYGWKLMGDQLRGERRECRVFIDRVDAVVNVGDALRENEPDRAGN